jgi:cyclopropane-fatty-acyl-phospholipid synthase
MRLLRGLLTQFVKNGQLRLTDAGGGTHVFGTGENGPVVTARLTNNAVEWKLFLNPELAAAEAYMDGHLVFEEGSTIHDLLVLFSVNREPLGSHPVQGMMRRLWKTFRRRQQANDVASAKAHARHHYDISTDLYRLFLDADLNYSCAYYRRPEMSLEEAQESKLVHALAKLGIKPGMSVLEIGGGWGAFAIKLAQAGANVTSLNVSPEQIKIAREFAEAAGVSDAVTFVQKDYREFEGQFDRLVSVGMMEHVGIGHLDEYFSQVKRLMNPDGYAFVHAIGRMTPPGTTGPFFRKYIFPGGYVPALSEVFAVTERQGLWVADMEVLRLHYAYTLQAWRERFAARREEAKALYDERFCRMWEFYLSAAELGFVHGSNMVFQLLISRKRDAVPITRDFLVDDERALLASI